MPGFMPDIHGFFGFVRSCGPLHRHARPWQRRARLFSCHSGAARKRRTRNPNAGTTLVYGFRVHGLRPRPGM